VGDLWSVSINHSANTFSATDLSSAAGGNVAGGVVGQRGFVELSQANISPPYQFFGFGLEIMDRVLLLRPGNLATTLAALVPGTCASSSASATYQFVALPGAAWSSATDSAYGAVQAAANGSNWSFSKLQQFTLAGVQNTGPALQGGACAAKAGSNAISLSIGGVAATAGIGPSGFFTANELLQEPSQSALVGVAGVVQPSAALGASNVVADNYLGFVYEPGVASTTGAVTQMALFGGAITGCVPVASTTGMCGGVFADDNLGAANSDTVIDLGLEDANSAGLFNNATVQVPDPSNICGAGTGVCVFPAVAVAGDPEGNIAIFLVAQNPVTNSPMAIYLFQQ
jgi:hypothetical protein